MPFLTRDYHIHFTGGEPLLSFILLQKIVALAQARTRPLGRKAHYSLTTNGSLISNSVLEYLGRHQFTVTLSFDGTAQNIQRHPGSYGPVLSRLAALRDDPRIRLKVNSVFSPQTVHCLSDSLRLLMDLNAPDIDFTLSVLRPWDGAALDRLEREMDKTVDHLLCHFRRTGRVALESFRETEPKKIFSCSAGRDRLAFAPEGTIWGCHLFSDYFREKERPAALGRYGFGTLDEFPRRPDRVRARLARRGESLAMDRLATPRGPCFLCPWVERCTLCPVNAAFSGSPLGLIPLYVCRIRKIVMKAEDRFRRRIKRGARERPRPPGGGRG